MEIVYLPVQSEFTWYLPVKFTEIGVPFRLIVAVPVLPPFPSKVSVPAPASGPAIDAGVTTNPVAVWAKVPFSVRLEHPLLSAFAAAAMPSASAVTAKEFKTVFLFIIVSFRFLTVPFNQRTFSLFSLPLIQAAAGRETRHGCHNFFLDSEIT